MLGILPIDFQLIWDAAVETNYQGQKVYFMSPEDVLLSVCINSRRRRYSRLKSLYEIAEHLNNKDAINWREFVRRVREARCNSIVYTSFLTTQLTLGCELPPGLREDLTINPLKASAISCIIRYLSRHVSLYSLHPYSDPCISIFGLKVNLEMLITHTIHLPNLIRHLYKQRLNFREISDIVKKD